MLIVRDKYIQEDPRHFRKTKISKDVLELKEIIGKVELMDIF